VFNKLAKEDSLGKNIKLGNGNVTSRILPIKIHELDSMDKEIIENEIGGALRAIEFIFKSAGVNRSLRAVEEHPQDNINKTFYRDQINKVANAIKEMMSAIINEKNQSPQSNNPLPTPIKSVRKRKPLFISIAIIFIALISYFLYNQKTKSSEQPVTNNSIAVLPFTNLSNDPEQDYFSDGITEQIITNLAHINSLKVIARTSVMKFKKTEKTIAEIGKELNVTHVLEGSIRKADDRVRITAQLIAVNDESHIWARDFDRKLEDIFAVQDEVSLAIAGSLQRKLSPQEYENMKSERTSSFEAYQRYLKASKLHNEVFYVKLLKEDFYKSEAEFKQVIKLDPAYGLAYAGLADLYDTYRNYSARSNEERLLYEAKRDSCSALALKLSPNNPYVISVKAYTFSGKTNKVEGDMDSIFKYRKRAFAISPNDAIICDALSVDYATIGLYHQAIQFRERAISLDPTYGAYYGLLGTIHLQLGEFKKAETALEKSILLDPNDLGSLRKWVELNLETNNLDEAEQTVLKIKAINPEGNRRWYEPYIAAMRLAMKGDKEAALNKLKSWRVYIKLGMNTEAISELEKINPHYLHIMNSPLFDPLRQEPRFIAILDKAKITYDDRLKKYAF
jgi:TolB-like protein/Tfp pilus assembly protein PilF